MATRPDILQPTAYSAMVIDNILYLTLGIVSNPARHCLYDLSQNTYTELNPPPIVPSWGNVNFGYGVSLSVDSPYGYYADKDNQQIWRYNSDNDAWQSVSLPATDLDMALFSLNNGLYSIGKQIYRYDFD